MADSSPKFWFEDEGVKVAEGGGKCLRTVVLLRRLPAVCAAFMMATTFSGPKVDKNY